MTGKYNWIKAYQIGTYISASVEKKMRRIRQLRPKNNRVLRLPNCTVTESGCGNNKNK